MTEGALAGIRVIELSEWVVGPYCGRLFAGLGADVVKVELPPAGDRARRAGPFPADVPSTETSGLFLYLNAGKRGVTLDWRTSSGRALLRRLLAEADVIIDGLGAEDAALLGLHDVSREQSYPRIVRVSVSDFGASGPYAGYASTELIALALGGMLSVTGAPDRAPLKNGGYLASYGTGQYAFVAALASLLDGGDDHIETALLDNVMTLTEVFPQMSETTGVLRRRSGNAAGPGWALLPCADGWVSVAIGFRTDLDRVADAMGLPGLKDPKFDDYAWGFTEHADEMTAILLGYLMGHTRREIYDMAQANHLAWGFVAFPGEMLEDEQLRAREYFQEIDHPAAGRLTYPGAPFAMSETPWVSRRAPLLGEHTAEVLAGIGVQPSELPVLRANGVI